jgi:hypothetical protein
MEGFATAVFRPSFAAFEVTAFHPQPEVQNTANRGTCSWELAAAASMAAKRAP